MTKLKVSSPYSRSLQTAWQLLPPSLAAPSGGHVLLETLTGQEATSPLLFQAIQKLLLDGYSLFFQADAVLHHVFSLQHAEIWLWTTASSQPDSSAWW